MTTTVLLFAPESACPIDRNPSDWAWVSVSETGAALEQGTGPLDQMPATSENRTIVLILDGQRVRILKEALPARSDAQARKTAPYVLEERLAAPPDKTHVAVGALAGDLRPLAICDHDWLAGQIAAVADRGIRPALAVADHTVLVADQTHTHCLDLGGILILKNGRGETSSVPDTLAPVIAPAVLDGAESVTLAGSEPGTTALQRALEAAQIKVVRADRPSLSDHIKTIQDHLTAESVINLLQGSFAPKTDWSGLVRVWKPTVALAASVSIALVASLFFEARGLHQTAKHIEASATTLMRTVLPNVRGIGHLESHVQVLKTGRSDTFLTLSAAFHEAIQSVSALSLVSVRYDGDRAAMIATVTAGDFKDLAALKSAIEDRGVTVVEGASRQNGGVILADLTLGTGAAS